MVGTATKMSFSRTTLNILRYSHNNMTTGKPNLALFKKINELAYAGKWDNINNAPKLFLLGSDKKKAYQVYAELLGQKKSSIDYTPWKPHLKFILTLGMFFSTVFFIAKSYEILVPESYRLKIKYAPKHDDEHH